MQLQIFRIMKIHLTSCSYSSVENNNKKVQISLTTQSGQLESPETYVIKSLILKNHALICILNQLMDWKSGIVRFNHISDTSGEGKQRMLASCARVLLPDLWYQKCTHAWISTTTKRVAYLETCKIYYIIIWRLIFCKSELHVPNILELFKCPFLRLRQLK